MSAALELELVKDQLPSTETRVAKINRLHGEVLAGLRMAAAAAWEIGKELNAQKAELEHGEWLPWLDTNVEFSHVTAWTYMKVYSNHPNIKGTEYLSIEGAAKCFVPDDHKVNSSKGPKTPRKPASKPTVASEVKRLKKFSAAEREQILKEFAPHTNGSAEFESGADIKDAEPEPVPAGYFDEDGEMLGFEDAVLRFSGYETVEKAYVYLEQFNIENRKRLLEIFKQVRDQVDLYLAPFGLGSMSAQLELHALNTKAAKASKPREGPRKKIGPKPKTTNETTTTKTTTTKNNEGTN